MGVIWEPALEDQARHWRGVADGLSRDQFAALADELDRDLRYPWESIPKLVDSGLAGLFVAEPHGGRGASLTATVAVVERIAEDCASTAAILCAYQLGALPLADVATEITAARLLLYQAAGAYDRGEDVQVIGAQAKLYCSEVAHRAAATGESN